MLVVGEGRRGWGDCRIRADRPGLPLRRARRSGPCTNEAIGLHLLGWRGSATCRVQSLIMQRIQGNASLSLPQIPGVFLG